MTSSAAEQVTVLVKLDPASTFAYKQYYLPKSIRRQATFTGTVEYEGQPDRTWQVLAGEADVKSTPWGRDLDMIDGKYWLYYIVNVPVNDGQQMVSLTTMVPDPSRSTPPARSPPPPPARSPPPPPPPPARPPPPPPASPRPASPPPSPVQPIVAYCIPMRKDGNNGCFLKVASATPGATVRFQLIITNEVPGMKREVWYEIPTLTLEPGKTIGGYFYPVENVQLLDTKFTGTVEYEGNPLTRWNISSTDPDTQMTRIKWREGLIWIPEPFWKMELQVPLEKGVWVKGIWWTPPIKYKHEDMVVPFA